MSVRDEIIGFMSERLYKGFAATTAIRIIELSSDIEELYSIATDNNISLPTPKKKNVLFRSAYTLEYIYFNYPDSFAPFRTRFICDFTQCQNASAKRHFSKIMADILKSHTLETKQMEAIAETAAEWVADPKIRVAVKIWSMAILKTLRFKVSWVDEVWDDLEGIMRKDATPAIEVRLKRGWQS